jgi:hypothetical protein
LVMSAIAWFLLGLLVRAINAEMVRGVAAAGRSRAAA